MLCLDPVQSNSVLSMFSLSLLADIQQPTSTMHSLSQSGCRGDVFTAAMQVQLLVIGKRVKSDTVSVNNVRKVSHVQHEQYWAKDWALWGRADDVHNRWGITGVHDSVCPTRQIWTESHQSCSTQAKLTFKSQQQQLVIDSVEGSC